MIRRILGFALALSLCLSFCDAVVTYNRETNKYTIDQYGSLTPAKTKKITKKQTKQQKRKNGKIPN